jgi:hypothetical protein
VRSHVPWDGLVLVRAKSREQSPATATADGQSPLGASWAPFDAAEGPPWANPMPHQDFISSTTPYSHGSCLILRVPGTLGRSQILGKLPVAACPPQRQKPVPLSRLDATVTVAPTGGRPSSQRESAAALAHVTASLFGMRGRRHGRSLQQWGAGRTRLPLPRIRELHVPPNVGAVQRAWRGAFGAHDSGLPAGSRPIRHG